MNPSKIYTRKTMGLDNRVWRLMIVMILLPLGLLSYRLMNKEKCISFSIAIRSLDSTMHVNDVFYTGETLSFTASIPAKNMTWDFGDNTGDVGPIVHHQYLKEGIVLIKASGNSLCEIDKQITINKPPSIPSNDTGNSYLGIITGPTLFNTYTPQKFTYHGPAASSYEWTIQNFPHYVTKGADTVSFTIEDPGPYTIQLQLDSDINKIVKYNIQVEEKAIPRDTTTTRIHTAAPPPLPPPPPPPVDTTKTAPSNKKIIISDETFFSYLQLVKNRQMVVADFDKYLCGGGTTPVIENGKPTTFAKLCEDMVQRKQKWKVITQVVKLEKANLFRQNDCVIRIEVKFKLQ